MILNIEMFNDENGEDIYIKKVSQSLNTMVLLQNNLTTFLHHSPSQITLVDINALVIDRLNLIGSLFPKIEFKYIELSDFKTETNQELLTRVIDNILSNAFKYNRPRGLVSVTIDRYKIVIKDSGKGIKDTKKIMQRYYREQDRGIGLGLHIVQKLTQELNIRLKIESKLNIGTDVFLYFPKNNGIYYG
jgi:signal transduction histidine kinase